MKINLKDTTFIIPIRVDSIIRLENLFLSIDSVLNYFETNIIILEAASYNNGLIKFFLKGKGTYNFIEDNDPIFHKTKYLNIMAKKVTTPYIAIWDVDIILDPHQIIDAIQQLREEKCDVAYPYSGTFLDTSDILRKHYLIHQDLDFLKKNSAKMNSLYTVEGVLGAVGGAVFIKTNKYFYAGMENENFYGWGLEDGERHYRWLSFNYIIYRSPGCLFHLSHPQDLNGRFRSPTHKNKALYDLNEIINYTEEELNNKFSIK